MKKNNFSIVNFGCRLNIYEGEVINALAKKNNLENYIIFNSCAVTEEAEKKLVYEIRKSKKNFANKKIIVTGCAAQINPEKYANLKGVNFVIGNNEKLQNETWSSLSNNSSINVKNIFENNTISPSIVEKFEGKSRAYIEIQQGCDHRCTFCIIPYGRGNNRSVPVGVIVNRIKALVRNNYNEVVLTGVDITDYGKDLPGKPNLFQLVKRILNLVPNLKQLRLSSLDCGEISDDFWPLLNEKRLMPHFHLSLQAGNDLILKRMKRRHNRQQVIDFCKKVRSLRGEAVFGADIIAGFPTESESMFQDSIKIINECKLTHLHIFPYSKRDNTPAAKMPQLPREIVKSRARILREEGAKQMQNYLIGQIGNTSTILIEQIKDNFAYGKTEQFTKIKIKDSVEVGTIVKCKITEINKDILFGHLI